MVSTTVTVVSSVPSGLHSSSAVRPSSAPPLPLHGDTVSDDMQGPKDLIREQRNAATRPAAFRHDDFESVHFDLFHASETANECN